MLCLLVHDDVLHTHVLREGGVGRREEEAGEDRVDAVGEEAALDVLRDDGPRGWLLPQVAASTKLQKTARSRETALREAP